MRESDASQKEEVCRQKEINRKKTVKMREHHKKHGKNVSGWGVPRLSCNSSCVRLWLCIIKKIRRKKSGGKKREKYRSL